MKSAKAAGLDQAGNVSTRTGRLDAVRKQMFVDFCAALESHDIPYVILAGHRDYPERIASDIDFMVGERDFARLPAILNAPECVGGAQIVQILEHEISARYFVLARQEGGRMAYLHPDSAASYRFDARLWLRSEAVLATRRRSPGGFWVPAAAVEFEYYLFKRVEKECVEVRHLEQLRNLLNEDASGCRESLRRMFAAELVQEVASAIARTDVDWFRTRRDALARSLRAGVPRESMPCRMRSRVQECLRIFRRVTNPTGFIVAILGPDGSGKTTVIEHLEKEFACAFRGVRRFHLRPHFGRSSGGAPVSDPHAQEPRGRFASCLKIGMFVADYWSGWLRQVMPSKIRSTLIVFDRYYHDLLVDQRRYRLPVRFALPRWISPLIPQPDLWLVLDAPAESLVARKGEISLESARSLTTAYTALAHRLPNAVIIDSGTSVDQTLQAAVRAVRERLGIRAQSTLRRLL
ncbi:hypothetical protein [Accumulibacter sp.]|jgi:thymidylate kinase|uniref:hypothetical protein n=1 Tax=Accumulibacter sp. TaxID=2053492 RepID=UPI001AC6BDD5|nr:hypothetical protein [Accumulibacter sp.]MBN8455595.1 hypothetical protein [Accumulibacter sp.]MBO3705860.1 hypothetical protein [Candidatus Accumulibacter conexus]